MTSELPEKDVETLAFQVQEALSGLTVDAEGQIDGVGPASFAIARRVLCEQREKERRVVEDEGDAIFQLVSEGQADSRLSTWAASSILQFLRRERGSMLPSDRAEQRTRSRQDRTQDPTLANVEGLV